MTDFKKATADDICAVHERSYVLGLEKLAARGRDDIVDAGAPTYITSTSFNDALQVLARISIVPFHTPGPSFTLTGTAAPKYDACFDHASVNSLGYPCIGSILKARQMSISDAGGWRSNGTGGCCGGGQQRQSPCASWLCNLPAPWAPCCAQGPNGLLPLRQHLHCCEACPAVPWA